MLYSCARMATVGVKGLTMAASYLGGDSGVAACDVNVVT